MTEKKWKNYLERCVCEHPKKCHKPECMRIGCDCKKFEIKPMTNEEARELIKREKFK